MATSLAHALSRCLSHTHTHAHTNTLALTLARLLYACTTHAFPVPSLETLTDSQAVRVRGWKRIALFALYFNPGAITVKSTADAFRDAQRTVSERARACCGGEALGSAPTSHLPCTRTRARSGDLMDLARSLARFLSLSQTHTHALTHTRIPRTCTAHSDHMHLPSSPPAARLARPAQPAAMKRLGWGGLYPWDWDARGAETSFDAIKDRPFVPPVLRELILDRQVRHGLWLGLWPRARGACGAVCGN